jgi:hypothetical protein
MNGGDWFDEQGAPDDGGQQTQPVGRTGGAPRVTDEAVQEILHKYPATNDGMRQAVAELDRTFGAGTIKLLEHHARLDKLVMPDGRTIDTVIGAGGGNPSWGWMVEGAGHGGGAGGAGGGLSGVGVSPEGRAFADMVMSSRGAVRPLLGDPMAGRPITDDPSYDWRLSQGVQALERSAAARGTLMTGGQLKRLARYGQDAGAAEYAASYGRREREQQNDFNRLYTLGEFMSGEQQNQFDRYYRTGALGLQATNNAQNFASGYADNIATGQVGIGQTRAGQTAANTAANVGTIGALGEMAGDLGESYSDWYKNRKPRPAGNTYPGTSIPVGVGL